MTGIKGLITQEPVMLQSLVQVTIALVTVFGFELNADQIAAIMAFTAVLLAVIARAYVTPTARIVERYRD